MKIPIIRVLATVAVCSTLSFTVAFAHSDEPVGEMTHMQEMALSDALYAKVQSGERTCASLSDADFELVGEHFMQGILGDMHESTNGKFSDVLSHEGEEELHALMGKYGTHCDATSLGEAAATPSGDNGRASLDTRDLVTKALLWIFALYGLFSLVKRFMPAKSLPQ